MVFQHCYTYLQKLTLPSLFADVAQCEMEYDGGINFKNWSWKRWLAVGLIAVGVIAAIAGIVMLTGGTGFTILYTAYLETAPILTITNVGIAGIVVTVLGALSVGCGVGLLIHDLI